MKKLLILFFLPLVALAQFPVTVTDTGFPVTTSGVNSNSLAPALRNKINNPLDSMPAGDIAAKLKAKDVQNRQLVNKTLVRLRQLANSAMTNNEVTNGVASEQPTVTIATTISGLGLTKEYRWDVTPSAFLLNGGSPKTFATSYVRMRTYKENVSGTSGDVNDGDNQGSTSVEFYVDSGKFAIGVLFNASPYRILVDGRYLDKTGYLATLSGGLNYIILDYGGVRKKRHVVLEMERAMGFNRVSVGPLETIQAGVSQGIRIFHVGDSITGGTGVSDLISNGYGKMVGRYLGVRDIWVCGSGGTGYTNTAGGVKYTCVQRIPDIAPYVNDNTVICISMGTNDPPTGLQAIVLTCLQAYKAAFPTVPVFVMGIPGVSAGTGVAVENQIAAAVAQFNDPNYRFVPMSTRADGSLLTGNGKATAPNGTGNMDIYMGSDGTHENNLGHEYLGRSIAEAITLYLNQQ